MSDKLRPQTNLRPPPGKLREYDKDTLLRWFEYRLTPEQRYCLMQEHPEAFNRWMGTTIALVTVFRDDDNP